MAEGELAIEHERTGDTGRYYAVLDDGSEAQMTYRLRDAVMTINYTGVPKPFEGRGIALKLVKKGIADARENGYKIVPQCSYVALQFRRHKDWADLLA